MPIQIRGLNKTYPGGVHALQDVNLEIATGMFGLLGPNGAGKTTLMKILATLETPTSGEVFIDGADIQTHRQQIRSSLGYLPQFFGAYPQLTGAEFLTYIAKLNGVPRRDVQRRVHETLANVGLLEARDRKTKTYSGGMMRRLGIAQALIANPRLLIVDEPTTGLDPEERIRFRNLLTEISRDKIIILSTHIVGDISSTCEVLAVLSLGKVVFHGHPETLVAKAIGKVWQVLCDEAEFPQIASRMQVISTIPKQPNLLLRVVGEPIPGYDMQSVPPNLEDAYMYFMESVVGQRVEEDEENGVK
ncbi:MAG: ABC transporter ATP-binding protein [candidate division KSB1 bacterium]|nr:ABC transporter ATP-binding protein [candidate division KSB1 bacterium]MDZ7302639.1 ABC transporter ATP-binding protein [candidate division KSB1 bacterium]MDZ7311522.1 ABC transporter ATP-binding protein [candidate division KSB1 bacterium]